MKKSLFIFVLGIALLLTGCWKSGFKEVAVTTPWDKMNLPLKENALVYESDDKELRVFNKGKIYEIAEKYINALEKDGWQIIKKESNDVGYTYEYKKNEQKIKLYIFEDYDSWIYATSRVNIVKQ